MRPAQHQQQQQQHHQHSIFGMANAHGIDYLVSKQRIHFYAMRVRNIRFHIHVFIFTAYALHGRRHWKDTGKCQSRSMQPSSHFHHDHFLMKLKLIKTSWSNRRLMMFFFRSLIYDATERTSSYRHHNCSCYSHCSQCTRDSNFTRCANIKRRNNRRCFPYDIFHAARKSLPPSAVAAHNDVRKRLHHIINLWEKRGNKFSGFRFFFQARARALRSSDVLPPWAVRHGKCQKSYDNVKNREPRVLIHV